MKPQKEVEEALLVSLFRLGEALFGIPAAQIQEVVQVGSMTPMRHASGWVVGIRNLRGRIVTVIDLGMRLDLGRAETGPESRILIVDVEGELVGLLVDKVEDTVFLKTSMRSDAPSSFSAIQGAALQGVYRCGNGLASLLDHRAILVPAKEVVSSR